MLRLFAWHILMNSFVIKSNCSNVSWCGRNVGVRSIRCSNSSAKSSWSGNNRLKKNKTERKHHQTDFYKFVINNEDKSFWFLNWITSNVRKAATYMCVSGLRWVLKKTCYKFKTGFTNIHIINNNKIKNWKNFLINVLNSFFPFHWFDYFIISERIIIPNLPMFSTDVFFLCINIHFKRTYKSSYWTQFVI